MDGSNTTSHVSIPAHKNIYTYQLVCLASLDVNNVVNMYANCW